MLRTIPTGNTDHEKLAVKRKKDETTSSEDEEDETLGDKVLEDDEDDVESDSEGDADQDFSIDMRNAKEDEEEKRLESLVFGSEASIFTNIEKVNKKVKVSKKPAEISEFFETKKAAWKDDADQEM